MLGILKIPKIKEIKIWDNAYTSFTTSRIKPDDVPFVDPEKEKGRFKLIEDKNEKLKRKRDKVKEQNELNTQKKQEYENDRARAGLRRNREHKKRIDDKDEIDELNQEKFIMRK